MSRDPTLSFVISTMALAIGLTASQSAQADSPLTSSDQEDAITRQCMDWFTGSRYESPTATKNLAEGLCFNGEIHAGDDLPFLTALASHPVDQPLVIVVRSPGGDADTALNMADAILDRPATVTAAQICGSACANYLLPAGQRRIVLADTLLLYHGGVTLDFIETIADQTRQQIETMAKGHPDTGEDIDTLVYKALDDTRQSLGGLVARQDAFLLKAGISPTLFRWMNLFNHMTPAEKSAHCAVEPHMIVYPVTLLSRFGLTLDIYDGPQSQAEVDSLASKMKLGTPMCYWQE